MQMMATYRFPHIDVAEATGENILDRAIRPGAKARQVVLTVIGEGAEVIVDGRVLAPERRVGDTSEYFARHVARYITDGGIKEQGQIESITVRGEGVTFFAEISA